MTKVDEYWAAFFGLSVIDFLDREPKVMPHVQLEGWQGAWLFRRGSSFVISVPPELVQDLGFEVQQEPQKSFTDAHFVALFRDRVDKVIGPAYQGYCARQDFAPCTESARLLSSADDHALRALAAECNDVEWEHGDIQFDEQPKFGCFVGSRLVAVSSYHMETENAASPGIITHPLYRGQGYGKAVLSAATEHGLTKGFLMLYQTLLLNKPAVKAAESLGYRQYATSLAVRLR